MIQQHLFDNATFAAVEKAMRSPISAKADPETSRFAANEITRSGKRQGQLQGVLALVKKYPRLTAVELAAKSSFDRYVLNRRLPELEHGGLIRKAGQRSCSIHRRPATIWEAN